MPSWTLSPAGGSWTRQDSRAWSRSPTRRMTRPVAFRNRSVERPRGPGISLGVLDLLLPTIWGAISVANLQASSLRAALVLAAVVLASGCDPGSSLSASNQSAYAFLLRSKGAPDPKEPAYAPPVQVWELRPFTSGIAVPRAIGRSAATVELLNASCQVVASWSSDTGGLVTIRPAGDFDFATSDPTPVGSPSLPDSDRCHG
jgi:hypothetical protein